MLRKKYILGIGITDETKENILEYILRGLKNRDEKYYIVTPNPEILVYTYKHPKFKEIINNARLALPDGIGVIWAGKILGNNFIEKVTGTDLLENLCFKVSRQPITVGFLGGRGKIAERTAECLIAKYPGLKVVLASPNWNFGRLPHVDLLFVAYGFPKQEEWMSENLHKLPVRVAMGVGGAFDYISSEITRAPVFIRKSGFEWLFRLIIQPWRIKRQLALLEFVWLVLKEKFNYKMSS